MPTCVFFFVLAETSFQNSPGRALKWWGYRSALHALQPAVFAMNVGDVTALGTGGWVASEDVGFETLYVYVCTCYICLVSTWDLRLCTEEHVPTCPGSPLLKPPGSHGCLGCLQSLSHWRKSITLGIRFQSCLYISPRDLQALGRASSLGPVLLQDSLLIPTQKSKNKETNKPWLTLSCLGLPAGTNT